ncbi:septation ring formation regulator EzrA, partial [Staphylococcus aureus]|nr:septation ring formation regulator EzrA [Staphylococcus aureus]
MVLYIILAIIVIILIAVGVLFYLRSNKRQIIEKAIERKNEIETLPFDQNLAQLSKLNLKGETKTKYDAMKKDNVESTNKYLAPVEEKIHNAEALLDKFSFNASQSEIDDANELMDSYEQSYQQQLEDVNEIIALYKDNDELYDKCKVDYREMKRDVLANRHQFGEAASLLETEIEKFEPRLEQYEVLKPDGNYVQAHNHIAALNEQMKQLRSYMEEIPELIRETQKELPGQFQDLKYGCRDLKVEGYDLDHVKVDSTLQSLKTELSFVEPLISRLELEEANDKLANINDKLDDMYDLIE